MKRYKLGEIADVIMGQSPESKYYNTEGKGLPFLQGNRTFGERYPDFDTYTSVTTKKAKAHDVLMSVRAPVGAVNITPIDVCLGRGLCALRMQNGNQDYLYYLMKYYSSQFNKSYGGTIFPSINRDEIKSLIVNIVDDKYLQQRIAKILSTIDAKIELNKKISRELETMAKELYDYWFVQFDFPNAQGKPYKSSSGKMVWNETLKREIPEGWEVTNIGNLTTVVTGKEDANFSSPNGKYKFFTCSQEALLCDTPAFSGQAVLIAGNGDFNVKHYSGEFNAYQRTYVLIPENQAYYGAMYISAKNQIQAFKNGSNGSIVKFITKGDVENIPFILPNDDSIFYQINKLIEKIELCERENEELTKLRDWLLPMLMNGQARVSEEKGASVSQKDDTNRFVLWKNTYPVAARGEKNDTVLRAMYEVMDDEDK